MVQGQWQQLKSQNFYWVKTWKLVFSRTIKILWGSIQKGVIFLVVGGSISKFLDSGGLLLIPCVNRQNPAIWSRI